MIKINVMRTFLNRLRDRGWKNINVRGYTDKDIQVLKRGDKAIIGVENINVDASGDIRPQIDEFFKSLIELIERTYAKEIFLPGGGDIPMPDFLKEYCSEYGIHIHFVTMESYKDIVNYNESY
jgi:hypothetical protein